MNTYLHTQRAGNWLWIPGIAAVVFVFVALLTGIWPVLAGLVVLAVMLWLFHSLTVEIRDGSLTWCFGPGFIRRTIPLSEISEARAVRTSWMEGWGIHYSRFGWLYNIAGFDAVALTLRDGKKMAVGTDEPAALVAALKQQVHP